MTNLLKLYFLILRFVKIKFNDKFALLNYFGVPIVIGFLTAFVMKFSETDYLLASNEKFKVYLFLIIIIAIFLGLTNSIREIVSFRAHYMKERRTGLSPALYYISIFIVLSTILLIQILLLTLVGDYILENPGSAFLSFIWPFLAGLSATVTGLFISSLVASETSAMIFIPLVLIPQIIFAGSLVSFDKMNRNIFITYLLDNSAEVVIPEISQVMISRWATEGYMVDSALQKDPQSECLNIWFTKADELRAKRSSNSIQHEEFVRLISINEKEQRKCDTIPSPINIDIENAVLDADSQEGQLNYFTSPKKYVFGTEYQTVIFNKIILLLYILIFILSTILSLKYNWWESIKNKLG